MSKLHIDFETFCELDVRSVGAEAYAEHESCEILMMAWAFDDEETQLWLPYEEEFPERVMDALLDDGVTKLAWNKTFEYAIFKHVMGIVIPHDQWRDPMVMAHSLSLPGTLEKVGKILGLDEDKAKIAEGKRLINLFCKLRKPTKNKPWDRATHENEPEKWELFKQYCIRDVVSEREIYHKLKKWDMPDHEWENWYLDQEINQTGLPIDMKLVNNALDLEREEKKRLLDKAKEITGLVNPNSVPQLLPWLKEHDYPFDDLTMVSVRKALKQDLNETLNTVLGLRQQWSKTSTRKFKAFKQTVSEDNRFRNAFQFAGAGRTWRWAGRKVQLQNLPRGLKIVQDYPEIAANIIRNVDLETLDALYADPVMELLASVIRGCIRALEGYKLVVADLNAIENRVLGWMTGCEEILDVFKEGLCPYKSFGSRWLDTPYEDITKAQRTLSKPAVLGAGYMLSGGEYKEDQDKYTGLWGYADSMGIKMEREEAHESVQVFRETYVEVVDYWGEIQRAAKKCVKTGNPTEAGPVSFYRSGPLLRMRLPSGRHLSYVKPSIRKIKMPWGKIKPSLTYFGLNNAGQWVRQSTHPGKLTENADQAISRDILMAGIRNATRRGFTIIGHVHDEIISMVKEDSPLGVKDLCEAMCEPEPWAEGLPLAAEGYESQIYKKD